MPGNASHLGKELAYTAAQDREESLLFPHPQSHELDWQPEFMIIKNAREVNNINLNTLFKLSI